MEQKWFNTLTSTFDIFEGVPDTDEKALQYIPQRIELINLYALLRHVGFSIDEAMAKVIILELGSNK